MSIDLFPLLKGALKLIISCLPILLVVGVIFTIFYCIKNKVKIKFRTFKGRGFRPKRGDFGLFVYCGSQGSVRVRLIHLLSI